MERRFCPSCKKKISGSAKKCPKCGSAIPNNNYARTVQTKVMITAVAAIITIALIIYVYFQEQAKPLTNDNSPDRIHSEASKDIDGAESAQVDITDYSPERVQAETLKNNIDGTEFSSADVMARFNSFLKDEGESLSITEFVLESGDAEDIYRSINDNISISIVSPKGRATVTNVSVLAESGNEKEFITYCMGLLSVFTPTMKPDIRQKVVFAMMEYTENGDTPLRDENTYIIVETKYTFTYSKQNGLNMLVEQMPALEEARPGELPPMIRQ